MVDAPMQTEAIKPTKLAHFVVKTRKYQEVVDWYRTVLGMEITHASPAATFLYFDDEHHRMAVLALPGLLPNWRGAAGVDHVAFTFDSVASLLQNYERLKSKGIEPIWSVNHGATLSFYYKDPDGNVVELQVDVFASREETNAFLGDGRFAINPIGIDVDADDLLARWKQGASHAELTAWPEVVEPRREPPPAAYIGGPASMLFKLGSAVRRFTRGRKSR